jgi:hypothetical protein
MSAHLRDTQSCTSSQLPHLRHREWCGAGNVETTREIIQKNRYGEPKKAIDHASLQTRQLHIIYSCMHNTSLVIHRCSLDILPLQPSSCTYTAKQSTFGGSSYMSRYAQRPATMFRTPPSTAMISPLTYVFLVKNSTACAISSSWPARPWGTWPFS